MQIVHLLPTACSFALIARLRDYGQHLIENVCCLNWKWVYFGTHDLLSIEPVLSSSGPVLILCNKKVGQRVFLKATFKLNGMMLCSSVLAQPCRLGTPHG